MRVRHMGMLVVAMTLTACDVGLDPALESFTYVENSQGELLGDTMVATPLLSQFAIQGELTLPTKCYSLEGTLRDSGRNLTINIIARRGNAACEPGAGAIRYQGLITNLEPGSYELLVIHRFSNAEKPDRQFRTTLRVQ